MTSSTHIQVVRRNGVETRRQAQQVALELFTTQGYENTTLKQIADELGLNKASLYYYFTSKEAILKSLFDERGTEAEQLVQWLREQPRGPGLLEMAVLRWVASFSADKLRGIRFMTANPLVVRDIADSSGDRVGATLNTFVDELTPLLPVRDQPSILLLRMSILCINAAVQAAADTGVDDADIITTAQQAARAFMREIRSHR